MKGQQYTAMTQNPGFAVSHSAQNFAHRGRTIQHRVQNIPHGAQTISTLTAQSTKLSFRIRRLLAGEESAL
jgi:hypothetical protein